MEKSCTVTGRKQLCLSALLTLSCDCSDCLYQLNYLFVCFIRMCGNILSLKLSIKLSLLRNIIIDIPKHAFCFQAQ